MSWSVCSRVVLTTVLQGCLVNILSGHAGHALAVRTCEGSAISPSLLPNNISLQNKALSSTEHGACVMQLGSQGPLGEPLALSQILHSL